MGHLSYPDKVEWLFNQFPVFQKIGKTAYQPTLDNTLRLVHLLDVPIHKMKFIHVAGTNGKGTTCSIMASALTVSGKKVGLFTSPHIKDFRERMRINGKMISKDKVEEYIDFFLNIDLPFSPSFFEMTWAMALAYFYKENCDIIVVETGMGGRLDATNIIAPALSVITNIGLEHIDILGDTRAEVAFEKAGIIKKDTPVIIGESDPETAAVFTKKAKEQNAPIEFLEEKEGLSTFETNKRLAFLALEHFLPVDKNFQQIKLQSIDSLYKNTGLYGRNHVYSKQPLIIMDAAHNFMGIQRFIKEAKRLYLNKEIRVLYGTSRDKDINEIITLFPPEWEYYFTVFNNKRSMSISEFKNTKGISALNVKYYKSAAKAFSTAQHTMSENTVLLVFGSFFLLEEII